MLHLSTWANKHAEHLRKALLRTYELTPDWTATVYSGMTLKWDYKARTCNISTPGYVSNVLSKFQHESPSTHNITRPGMSRRSTAPKPNIPRRMKHRHSRPNNVLRSKKSGDPLCTTPYVDPTVLMPLNDIAMEQSKATEKTQAATNKMLDYLATRRTPPSGITPPT
jgi:hypothetical protein